MAAGVTRRGVVSVRRYLRFTMYGWQVIDAHIRKWPRPKRGQIQ
jgi:hypothetical protein